MADQYNINELLKNVHTLMSKGRFEESSSMLEKLLTTSLGNAQLNYLLGVCYGRLGRLTDAVNVLGKAAEINPGADQYQFMLGIAYLETKQLTLAISSFSQAIKLNATNVGAYLNLAKVELILGDITSARKNFDRVLALNPELAEAYYGIGCIEHESGDSEKAIEFLTKSLQYQPRSADTLRMLASVMEKNGDTDSAIKYYKRALDVNPQSVQAVAGLALIYEYTGDIEKAISLIQPFIDTVSNNPVLAVAFAKICKHMNKCEQAISYIESTLAIPDLENIRIRKNLHFVLAGILDEKQEFDSAFMHFKQANELAMSGRYDNDRHIKMIDHIINTYDSKLLSQLSTATSRDPRPVFIIGMPRSGTSLTEQILASHRDVYAAGELKILGEIIADMPNRARDHSDDQDRVYNLQKQDIDNMASIYYKYLDGLSEQAIRITDKMPHNFYYLGLIQILFPGARIIHLTRDPSDNCLSIYFQNFSHGHEYANDLFEIGAHYHQYQRMMEHWRGVIDLPLLEISYEELVCNQEKVTREILDFCDLSWDESCLQFHTQKRNVFTSSYQQVRQPLYKESIGRWHNYKSHLKSLSDGLSSSV